MTDSKEISAALGQALKTAGFSGRGARWWMPGDGVQWMTWIDSAPRTGNVGLVVGLDLRSDMQGARADDCPIVLYAETFAAIDPGLEAAGTDRSEFRRAGSPHQPLRLETRRQVFEKVASVIAAYTRQRLDYSSVLDSFRAGEFEAGFVSAETRAQLSAD